MARCGAGTGGACRDGTLRCRHRRSISCWHAVLQALGEHLVMARCAAGTGGASCDARTSPTSAAVFDEVLEGRPDGRCIVGITVFRDKARLLSSGHLQMEVQLPLGHHLFDRITDHLVAQVDPPSCATGSPGGPWSPRLPLAPRHQHDAARHPSHWGLVSVS